MASVSKGLTWVRDNQTGLLLVTNGVTLGALVYLWAEPRGGIQRALKNALFSFASAVPGVSGFVGKQLEDIEKGLREDLLKDVDYSLVRRELPQEGVSAESLEARLESLASEEHRRWESGRVSGVVYHGGDDLTRLMVTAFRHFALSNPLHPDIFPHVRTMEAEVVSMCLHLFNGAPEGAGNMTSGGTESILMACKAYRDWGRTKGITNPEMVIPATAHAAFDKACHYFGIKKVAIEVDQETFCVRPEDMERAITGNTVMLVGSAVSFPQGTMDPIPELSDIAVRHGLPLHVDSCLGSFMVALANEAGASFPAADFRNEGVTSISCDTHKFGFAPKGSSVIMYRSKAWRSHQFYVQSDWPGGVYASPTIAGSRPGALIATTWATMVHIGKRGYLEATRRIIEATERGKAAVREMDGLELYGDSPLSVICFGPDRKGANSVDVLKVANGMSARKWNLNILQRPTCVHLCVTYANAPHVDEFVSDLRDVVEEVRADPNKYRGGKSAVYGAAATFPDAAVEHVAHAFLNLLTDL